MWCVCVMQCVSVAHFALFHVVCGVCVAHMRICVLMMGRSTRHWAKRTHSYAHVCTCVYVFSPPPRPNVSRPIFSTLRAPLMRFTRECIVYALCTPPDPGKVEPCLHMNACAVAYEMCQFFVFRPTHALFFFSHFVPLMHACMQAAHSSSHLCVCAQASAYKPRRTHTHTHTCHSLISFLTLTHPHIHLDIHSK